MKMWKSSLWPEQFTASDSYGGRVNVDFTPNDILYHHNRFQELKRNGLPIPLTWEHQTRAGTPKTQEEIEQAIADQARLFCGWCEDSRVNPDTGELEFLVNIPDGLKDDCERIKAIGRVSPAFADNFVDGKGIAYPGMSIMHLAVTPRPIQSVQRGFELGHNMILFSLGNPMADEEYTEDTPEEETEEVVDDMPEEDDFTEDDFEEPTSDESSETETMARVRANMKEMYGLDVSPAADEKSMLEHWDTALMTAKAHKENGMGNDDMGMGTDDEETYETNPDEGVEEEMPNASVVMSLQAKLVRLENSIKNTATEKIDKRLEAVIKRVPKTVAENLRRERQTLQLSLGPSGKILKNSFLSKLEMAEQLTKKRRRSPEEQLDAARTLQLSHGYEEVDEPTHKRDDKPLYERTNKTVMNKLTGGRHQQFVKKRMERNGTA